VMFQAVNFVSREAVKAKHLVKQLLEATSMITNVGLIFKKDSIVVDFDGDVPDLCRSFLISCRLPIASFIVDTSFLSKVHNCAVPPDHLRSEISFSVTCSIPNLISFIHIAKPFYRLKRFTGCVSTQLLNCMLTKTNFAQCKIFLEGTLTDTKQFGVMRCFALCFSNVSIIKRRFDCN